MKGPGAAALWLGAYYEGNQLYDGYIKRAMQLATGDWIWGQVGPFTAGYTGEPYTGIADPNYRMVGSGDVDGDGLVDIVWQPDASKAAPNGAPSSWPRDGHTLTTSCGATAKPVFGYYGASPRFRLTSSYGPSPATVEGFRWSDDKIASSVVDLNGDGFGDLAFVTMQRTATGANMLGVKYWPGDGRGNFTACTSDQCDYTGGGIDSPGVTFPAFDIGPEAGAQISADNVSLADINGDGFADLIVVTPEEVSVYWNADGSNWGDLTAPNLSVPGRQIDPNWKANWPPRMTFADINGNGLTDIVFLSGGHVRFIDSETSLEWPIGVTRPGLLTKIENGLGASTEITYETTAVLAKYLKAEDPPWPLPQVQNVVQHMTVRSGIDGDEPIITIYSYDHPVYDRDERRFRGFQHVGVDSPLIHTDLNYFIGDSEAEYRGSLLRSREISSHDSLPASLIVTSYHLQDVAAGLLDTNSGVNIYPRLAYPEQVDTFLYDTNTPATGDGTTAATITLNKERTIVASDSIPIRSKDNAHLRQTTRLDDLGEVIEQVDSGRITADEKPWDNPIRKSFEIYPAREDWKFLRKTVTVDPFADRTVLGVPTDQPRVRKFEYESNGRLSRIVGQLTGTLSLDRRHEDDTREVADKPASGSRNGDVLLLYNLYDAFGNVIQSIGPNGRCGATTFDKDFAQLAVRTKQFAAGCSGPALSAQIGWDRGLKAATLRTASDGAVSRTEYDAFGRLSAVFEPDPVTGTSSTAPSSTIAYHINIGDPVQRVEITAAAGGGRTHTSWLYSDSLGRQLLDLEQADPSAGDQGAWVASGLPLRQYGLVRAIHQPWFYAGDPANHPLTQPATASTKIDYDSSGRPVALYALDGTLQRQRRYQPLGVEDIDVLGRVSTRQFDGHGFLEKSSLATGADGVSTVFARQAGGEVAVITQQHFGELGGVTRWMQYDSLGRLVLNAEPNTSEGFSTVGAAGAMHAWRYAYDDSGELVGTSDARGCGKNLTYDGFGRPVSEDFSPCLKSQEPYSKFDPSTGNGAEILRIYDAPEAGQTSDFGRQASLAGRLSAIRDRGAHTRFGYDARGRVVSVARQLARPSTVAPSEAGAGLGALRESAAAKSSLAAASQRSILVAFLAAAALGLRALRRRAPSQRLHATLTRSMTAASLMLLLTSACGGSSVDAGGTGRSYAALTDARYEATWSRRQVDYDDADHPVWATTGADLPELLGPDGLSAITSAYSIRGVPTRIAGSYGVLVNGERRDADGALMDRSWGDVSGTTTSVQYDAQRRAHVYSVGRSSSGPWAAGGSYVASTDSSTNTLQKSLIASLFTYDAAGRLGSIGDVRDPTEWPTGFAPVSSALSYDDFDRVSRVDYTYQGSASWRDPLARERSSGQSPVPSATPANRTGYQTYDFDWRGNIRSTGDDANLLWDRGLGAVSLGSESSGPDQIRAAGSGLEATHDSAGNLTDLLVARTGACTDVAGCVQRLHYDWDEVGELARARRWDFQDRNDVPAYPAIPTSDPAADLRYLYDGSGSRVLKESSSAGGSTFTAEIFPSLRLEGATWDNGTSSYTRSVATEAVYLNEVARLVYGPDLPSPSGNPLHVLLILPDHLGSSSALIDRETGELVERTTQQAYGAPDSDYRPDRWAGYREPYQFTGKEDDYQVGLTYFGARYYSAALGRFISADPLTIHAFAGDSNPYAYVHGGVLSATDPFGLSCEGSIGAETCDPTSEGSDSSDPSQDNGWAFTGGGPPQGGGTGVLRGHDNGAARVSVAAHNTVSVMANGLNPSIPEYRRRLLATMPDDVIDQGTQWGTSGQLGRSAWNGIVHAFPAIPGDVLTPHLLNRYFTFADDGEGTVAGGVGGLVSVGAIAAAGGGKSLLTGLESGLEAGLSAAEARAVTSLEDGVASRIAQFSERNLQKGFQKHGADFGLTGNWNPGRASDFSRAVNMHLNDPAVVEMAGTYRGAPVTHFYNPASGLNVMLNQAGEYVGGWRLGAGQLEALLRFGGLQ